MLANDFHRLRNVTDVLPFWRRWPANLGLWMYRHAMRRVFYTAAVPHEHKWPTEASIPNVHTKRTHSDRESPMD